MEVTQFCTWSEALPLRYLDPDAPFLLLFTAAGYCCPYTAARLELAIGCETMEDLSRQGQHGSWTGKAPCLGQLWAILRPEQQRMLHRTINNIAVMVLEYETVTES